MGFGYSGNNKTTNGLNTKCSTHCGKIKKYRKHRIPFSVKYLVIILIKSYRYAILETKQYGTRLRADEGFSQMYSTTESQKLILQ